MSENISGRYQLKNEIGVGGMGAVFEAHDRLTGETVALKQVHIDPGFQLHDTMTHQETHEMMRVLLAREFELLAGLRHPHIISVLDYGFDTDQQPFYTMTFLEKSETILERGASLEPLAKIDLIEQLLQGLAYLHRRGILHRDIKPGNILVVDGVVKLLDFGLSHRAEDTSGMGGSPLYVAPELIEGHEATAASDLFAVGILLYQLQTDRHPFGAFDYSYYNRLLQSDPDFDLFPEPFRPIAARLLAKNPERRYQRANEVLADLAAVQGQSKSVETELVRESYLQAAKFIGRDAERDRLRSALLNAKTGRGSSWLLGGESGVGKSRFLRELQSEALVQGFQVLMGQSIEDGVGDGEPYRIWREPLRHLLVTLPGVDALTASVLLPLVPDIEQLLGMAVEPAPKLDDKAAQTRLFTTIARLFWESTQPILLLLEDIHWESEGLIPLAYLNKLVAEHPVVVIGSYRSDEVPQLPQQFPQMQVMPLPRLTAVEMGKLSVAMLGRAGEDQAIVDLLQKETEGNTFFATEIVRALAEEAGHLTEIQNISLPHSLLPRGIEDFIRRRISRLAEWARPLLHKAAIAGLELEIPLLERLNDNFKLDLEMVWLPACADAAILEVRNGVWQFVHGKIRDGLLTDLTENQKGRLHAEVANGIEALHPDDLTQAVRLAHHWQQAHHPEKERYFSEVAGWQAAEQFAHQEALAYFVRVLELTPAQALEQRYMLHKACLTVYTFMGESDNRLSTLETMSRLIEKGVGNESEQLEVLSLRVKFYMDTGQIKAAERLLPHVLDLARAAGDLKVESSIL
ncbi:MAG: protein kinase, partial [Chloroflexota bacterium]